jgi:hypothetical protein
MQSRLLARASMCRNSFILELRLLALRAPEYTM